ncbi:extracellular solute-binding protein [Candidatus Daviesbacteria bacterium]|nr:extracellular solute-binding protein [Candidatus Daviesbacteria bacterium]
MRRTIIIVLALAVVLGFVFWRFGPNLFNRANIQKGPVNITYWGLWEDENLIKQVIAEFESKNPNIKVNYLRQSSTNYRTRVQTQVREGVGPDVFTLHNSWLIMFDGDLAPAPNDILGLNEYKSFYYPVAEESFVKNSQIFAVPIEIDGLALYYNEELLQAVGVTVPKNWQEFIDSAVKMTVRDSSGQIQRAGAALGATGNIDHFSDILGLLLLQQPNVSLEAPNSPQVAEILRFYTSFVTDPKKKTWDLNLPNSTQMFAQGRLAYYFAPSWRAHELRQINQNLKFKTAPVPQLSGKKTGWASFWGVAVSAKSQNAKEAWKFGKFLGSEDAQKMIYSQASQVRLFGMPYATVQAGQQLQNDPLVGSFVTQGPIYKFWYLSSNTFDNGINDEVIKYYEDGINATLQGTDPQVALQTVEKGVQQVLQKYTQPAPAPTGQ